MKSDLARVELSDTASEEHMKQHSLRRTVSTLALALASVVCLGLFAQTAGAATQIYPSGTTTSGSLRNVFLDTSCNPGGGLVAKAGVQDSVSGLGQVYVHAWYSQWTWNSTTGWHLVKSVYMTPQPVYVGWTNPAGDTSVNNLAGVVVQKGYYYTTTFEIWDYHGNSLIAHGFFQSGVGDYNTNGGFGRLTSAWCYL
jgi:hypothetical protein